MKIRLLIIPNNLISKSREYEGELSRLGDFESICNKNSSIFRLFLCKLLHPDIIFSQKSVFLQKCKITSVTHINLPVFIFLGSSLCTGSPSQKFNSPWVEAFTLSRNTALSLSFDIIRIRHKQKTRQQRSHVSLIDRCLTRVIEGTVRRKTYCTLVRYVGMVRFKNWTEVRYSGTYG